MSDSRPRPRSGTEAKRAQPVSGPASSKTNPRWVWAVLAVVMLLGLLLRAGALSWGVPKEPFYRNYYQDERFVLGLLFKMDPDELKLDPEYYINPTLHYYSLLAALEVGRVFGLPVSFPVQSDSPFKPADMPGTAYASLFMIGRWLVVIESVLSILLLYLIGRELYNWRTGLFAALLLAVSYPCMYQAHFITADGPALAWLILSLYGIVRLFRAPESRLWRILAPVGIGLAIGAKYLNVLALLPYGYVLWAYSRKTRDRQFARRLVLGLLVMAGAFLVTTPYALLSFGRFLNGDENGFGGIFGARGMMFYNNFPPSITEPFAVTSLAALNIVGLLAFVLSLVVLFKRRKPADLLLLSFIVPFYLMLMYKSSPMLRHILPVLPFIFVACAAALTETTWLKFRTGVAGMILLGVVALSWLGLSVAAIQRMGRTDTRVQAEQWAKQNVTTETIALPTWFPYRYSPSIDSFPLLPLNYDARGLEARKPEYLLMVEPEYVVNGRQDDKADRKLSFTSAVAGNPNYTLVKTLEEPFRLLGLSFRLKFPTEDWNYPSPEILIYRRR